MNPEIGRVQKELEEIKDHRADLLNYLCSIELTSDVAYTLLDDTSFNAVEYTDIIRSLNKSHLEGNQKLSSAVIKKLAAYNPGGMPLDTFCYALTYTDRSNTLYLYASLHFITTIPDEDKTCISKIVDIIKSDLQRDFPKNEDRHAFQRAVDSILELLERKKYNL